MIKKYHLKFYLNAAHAVQWEHGLGELHHHTWEIQLEIQTNLKNVIPFDVVEEKIESFMNRYQDTTLNDEKPFDTINPTLENVTDVLFKSLTIVLAAAKCHLAKLTVSENPTRAFSIEVEPLLSAETFV